MSDVLDACDAIDAAKLLIEAARMACEEVENEVRDPIHAVLFAATDKLVEASGKLESELARSRG